MKDKVENPPSEGLHHISAILISIELDNGEIIKSPIKLEPESCEKCGTIVMAMFEHLSQIKEAAIKLSKIRHLEEVTLHAKNLN